MSWVRIDAGRIRVDLRVRPGARRQGVKGLEIDAHGAGRLSVHVNAPPAGGEANGAVVKLLAKRWRIAPSRISLVSGAKGRLKVLEISDGDRELLDKIVRIEDTGQQSDKT